MQSMASSTVGQPIAYNCTHSVQYSTSKAAISKMAGLPSGATTPCCDSGCCVIMFSPQHSEVTRGRLAWRMANGACQPTLIQHALPHAPDTGKHAKPTVTSNGTLRYIAANSTTCILSVAQRSGASATEESLAVHTSATVCVKTRAR